MVQPQLVKMGGPWTRGPCFVLSRMFVLFCQSGIRSLDVTVHNSVSVNDLPSSHPDYFLFCLHLQDISVPDIVPAEYRDVSKPLQTSDNRNAHPLTGSERRYVLGDRFHNSSNPHKSHLCQFHDINLSSVMCVENQLSRVRKSQKEYPQAAKLLCSRLWNSFLLQLPYGFLSE